MDHLPSVLSSVFGKDPYVRIRVRSSILYYSINIPMYILTFIFTHLDRGEKMCEWDPEIQIHIKITSYSVIKNAMYAVIREWEGGAGLL